MTDGKFNVQIRLDNEAFEGDPNQEIARILRDVAKRVERGERSGVIQDHNGNSVGTFLQSRALRRAGKPRSWGQRF